MPGRSGLGGDQCRTDEQWKALSEVAGDDVDGWCATRTAADATDTLLAAGVPAAPVIDDSVLDSNEQLRARGSSSRSPARWRQCRVAGWPMRIDGGPDRWYDEPAPMLGEDNESVLVASWVCRPRVAALQTDAVIGTAPTF